MINYCALSGYIARDAKVITGSRGQWVALFQLPVWQGKDKDAMWVDCIVSDSDELELYGKGCDDKREDYGLQKGAKVSVRGRLTQEKYTRKDGSEGSALKMFCKEVEVVEKPNVRSKETKKPAAKKPTPKKPGK